MQRQCLNNDMFGYFVTAHLGDVDHLDCLHLKLVKVLVDSQSHVQLHSHLAE